MTPSNPQALLALADAEGVRLRRHLLVAAALRRALSGDPIVVGGTAQEFWTAGEYHETDLDLCVALTPKDRTELSNLGFRGSGSRHWLVGKSHPVAVEFPEARIHGDERRTVEFKVDDLDVAARIIGVDDLYLDRLRQLTMNEAVEGIEFHSALAVAAGALEDMDWAYVAKGIAATKKRDRILGEAMARIDRRIRDRVRRALT